MDQNINNEKLDDEQLDSISGGTDGGPYGYTKNPIVQPDTASGVTQHTPFTPPS